MAKKYTYGHGGETESIGLYDQMREAQKVLGNKKWSSLSDDDKKKLTEYLVMKGEVEEDLGPEYDSAGFTEEDRVVDGQYMTFKKGGKPKVIHTQFEEEEFEYADGGKIDTDLIKKIYEYQLKFQKDYKMGGFFPAYDTRGGDNSYYLKEYKNFYTITSTSKYSDVGSTNFVYTKKGDLFKKDYVWIGNVDYINGTPTKSIRLSKKDFQGTNAIKVKGDENYVKLVEYGKEIAKGKEFADGGYLEYLEGWSTKRYKVIGNDQGMLYVIDSNLTRSEAEQVKKEEEKEYPGDKVWIIPNDEDIKEYLTSFADGGMMAKGGRTSRVSKVKDWYTRKYPTDDLGERINDSLTFQGLWAYMSQGEDVYEVLGVGDSVIRERVFEKLSEILGVDYDVVYDKWLVQGPKTLGKGKVYKMAEEYTNPKYMAHGGKTHTRHRKQTLEEKAMESVGASTWFQLDKETQAGVIAEMLSMGALPQRMAKGAKVDEKKEFSVTFELMDGKKVTEKYESQEAMDDGIANFYIMNDVKDAIVGGAKEPEVVKEEVKEVKKEEKPKKKSLFDVEKAAPKVSKSKETAPVVHVSGLEKEIQRYDELKAVIKNAESEKEVLGGVIKDVAKEKYLEVYEQQGKRPTSITIESGGAEINYTVLDKYKIVTPEKETVLKEYDNLLGTDYTFTFDNEILDKEGKNGEKIADIINELIENSEDIPEEYKSKLVKITKKVGVKKGSIERLLDYKSPSEILQVIEPVEMLK